MSSKYVNFTDALELVEDVQLRMLLERLVREVLAEVVGNESPYVFTSSNANNPIASAKIDARVKLRKEQAARAKELGL